MKKTPEKLQETPTLTNIKIKKERTKTKKIKQNSIRKQARTQASSLIGPCNLPDSMRLEQHSPAALGRNSNGAVLGVGQNTSSHKTGRMVSGVSEGNCDVLNDEVILGIIVYFPICRAISGGSLPVLLTTLNKQSYQRSEYYWQELGRCRAW